ncbi:hypothetical protein BDN72DRAFT_845347 [Pluteus cervinus]|uniref:Uncharacterized protein n=1 Tax=Pluteus cervinus TaxID=181527 RepID=A0ACD3AIY5_9AGAR|nr:hypothetical protein BDN72DRAFT_845347 [Pluteus cervinus]
MLLRHEVYGERNLYANDLRAEKTRTFAHLRIDPLVHSDGSMFYTGSRDLLKGVPLNSPTRYEIGLDEWVTITLLDANHCLGAIMFLIEGAKGSILHTGDFRAEAWFLESLKRSPSLQPYLAPAGPPPGGRRGGSLFSLAQTLDAIYLDTACVLSNISVPTKNEATTGLVELMQLFPDNTHFFINSWTWGYEDILKAVATAFQAHIHVDRYKHGIYNHISDTFLHRIATLDASATRFHACERFDRCDHVAVDEDPQQGIVSKSRMGHHVVYVNPVTMGSTSWMLYLQDTKSRLAKGEVVNNLLVPLSRHSPLPELRAFVSLFRPRKVVPNTLIPRLNGLDWLCINTMFADCLSESPSEPTRVDTEVQPIVDSTVLDELDVALQNLVGDGAEEVAKQWADDGKLRKKLAVVRAFLGTKEQHLVDTLLGAEANFQDESKDDFVEQGKGKGKQAAGPRESDEDTNYSEDDDRGRTAHILFASLAGLDETEAPWWTSSPPSSPAQKGKLQNPMPSTGAVAGQDTTPRAGPSRLEPLTPDSSQQVAKRAGKKRPRQASPPQTPTHRQRTGNRPESPICLFSSSPTRPPPKKRKRLENVPKPQTQIQPPPPVSTKPLDPTPPLNEVNNVFEARLPVPSNSTNNNNMPRVRVTVFNGTPAQQARPEPVQVRPPDPPSKSSKSDLKPSERRKWYPPQRSTEGVGENLDTSKYDDRAKRNLQCLNIAEQLSRARPDLVSPAWEAKRAKLVARQVKYDSKHQYLAQIENKDQNVGQPATAAEGEPQAFSYETVRESLSANDVDWNRSRLMAEGFKRELQSGRKPSIPMLMCTDYGFEPKPAAADG